MLRKTFYVLLFLTLIGVVFSAQSKYDASLVNKFNVTIDVSKGDNFLTPDDIKEIVALKMDTLIGKPIKDIQLKNLEHLVNEIDGVKKAHAFFNSKGVLNVDVETRKVVMRILPLNSSKNSEGFYIDEDGIKMKWIPNYTPKVLTATGFFEKYPFYENDTNEHWIHNQKLINDLYSFYESLKKHKLSFDQVSGLNINESGELEIFSAIGNHKLVFGEIADLEHKMNKINVFYQKIIPKVGWDKYGEINLKYKQQIVCN